MRVHGEHVGLSQEILEASCRIVRDVDILNGFVLHIVWCTRSLLACHVARALVWRRDAGDVHPAHLLGDMVLLMKCRRALAYLRDVLVILPALHELLQLQDICVVVERCLRRRQDVREVEKGIARQSLLH